MRNCPTTMKKAGVVLLAVMAVISCSKDEAPEISEPEAFDLAELQASDETELISEEILSISEDVYATDEFSATSRANYSSDYLPDCVAITTVVTATSREKTIDFGLGCELPNGNVLSGIIFLTYEKDMEAALKTLKVSLIDFTFNNVAVQGSASLERRRANEQGNPQSHATAAFTATWPEGETASFSGNRTREWIEGYGSGFWGDNVFLIRGESTYTGPLGNAISKEIKVPLRRELSCRFLVSGILEISRNESTATLDFGDGNCDAKGILTYPDGSSKELFLRRFWR